MEFGDDECAKRNEDVLVGGGEPGIRNMSYRRHLKVVVVGSAGVGKTSLLEQFVNNRFIGKYKATVGLDFLTTEVMVGESLVVLQLWDTAGQERYSSLGTAFYRGSEGCILVFDKTNSSSFKRLQAWKHEFMAQCAPPNPSTFPLAVLGNKCDAKDTTVPRAVAEAWCKEQNVPYFEVSARDNINVRPAFMDVVTRAVARKPAVEETFVPDSLDLTDDTPSQKSDKGGCCN